MPAGTAVQMSHASAAACAPSSAPGAGAHHTRGPHWGLSWALDLDLAFFTLSMALDELHNHLQHCSNCKVCCCSRGGLLRALASLSPVLLG